MKTISILNLKGGVAKTFTAANMAYELYRRGYKVLLIDNDKQGNLSKAYSRYDAENVAPVTKLLAGDWESADELIQHTEYEGIDIVTANMSLFGATWNLTKEDSGNQIERYKALVYAKVQYYGDCTIYGKYDYCIIDNPPDIGLTGAGTNYAKTGETTGKGVFTIVEVKAGQGASAGWGRLKSGAGWISLDYATRLA